MAGTVFFYFLALVTTAGAVGVVALPNPLYCVLSLVAAFIGLAGLYLTLGAQFIAAVQVIIYAGAIMMLFLFVVMLINLGEGEGRGALRLPFQKLLGTVVGLAIFIGLLNMFVSAPLLTGAKGLFPAARVGELGNTQVVGKLLLTQYLLPFQAMGVLLFVGIIGAVVLARRRSS